MARREVANKQIKDLARLVSNSGNRDRLIEHETVTDLFNATVDMANKRGLLSGEHFSVDARVRHQTAISRHFRQPSPTKSMT